MLNVLCVIIPVHNEEEYIEKVLDAVLKRQEISKIIVINDGSTDNTSQILEKYQDNSLIEIIDYKNNKGKGYAIRKALKKNVAPYVIIQDADLEYSITDYPALLTPLVTHSADVVFGVRFSGNNIDTFTHKLGNRIITILSNFLTGFKLNDVETCYKVFRSEILKNLNLNSNRFEIEVEIVAKLSKIKNLRIKEIPISYNPRSYAKGKKITWKDGIKTLYYIFKYYFKSI